MDDVSFAQQRRRAFEPLPRDWPTTLAAIRAAEGAREGDVDAERAERERVAKEVEAWRAGLPGFVSGTESAAVWRADSHRSSLGGYAGWWRRAMKAIFNVAFLANLLLRWRFRVWLGPRLPRPRRSRYRAPSQLRFVL